MGTPNMPRLSFQRQSQVGEDCWHSIIISLLRGLAAFIVAAGHLRSEMYPGLRTVADAPLWFKGFAFATGFGHQAVMVFFVISGWLVGGSLLNKMGQSGALANYAIDRVTRLWTVLIPTFGLTLLFGIASGALRADSIDFSAANEFSALSFAGNLVGMQRVTMADFGGNYALWSLANETWYYLMFPLLVLLMRARGATARIASGAALALAVVALPVDIVLYFTVWLLGVAFSRLRIDCGIGARCAWLVLLAAVSAYFRITGNNDAFNRTTIGMDLGCSLVLLVLLSSLQFKAVSTAAPPLARAGKFFADWSFSLYVLHIPLIGLLKHVAATEFGLRQLSPTAPLHFAVYLGMLAALMAGSYLSYLVFESQTFRIRRWLKQSLARRATSAATAAAPVKR